MSGRRQKDPYSKEIGRLEEEARRLKKLSLFPGVRLDGFLKGLYDRIRQLAQRRKKNPAWSAVQLSRHPKRPQTLDYIRMIFDSFVELHGDRRTGDDPAIVAGIGKVGGRSVVFMGHQKGHDTQERLARNFGMAGPAGYHKCIRLMGLADKFGLPIITFVDTPGAYPAVEAEQRGQGYAISSSIMKMAEVKVPTACFIIGEGGSGGALALAVADAVYMLENATYSVISPEGCAAILWKDSQMAPIAAESLKLTARDAKQLGVADEIIPEPRGGAHKDPQAVAKAVKEKICEFLNQHASVDREALLEKRIARYMAYGAGQERE